MSLLRFHRCLALIALLPGVALGNTLPDDDDGGLPKFTLIGSDGDDLLRGGDGKDTIYGGSGVDRIFGGDGADRFVFDFDATETDEILDFDPAEGDEIWIRMTPRKPDELSASVKLRTNRIDLNLKGAATDRVRLNKHGDVEVRFQDRDWTQLVRTGRSRFDVKINRAGDYLRLRFQQQF